MDIEKKRVFDVDVVLRETVTHAHILLTIGKDSWEHRVDQPADRIHFKGLSLPRGPAHIQSVIRVGEKEMGPARMVLFQR